MSLVAILMRMRYETGHCLVMCVAATMSFHQPRTQPENDFVLKVMLS